MSQKAEALTTQDDTKTVGQLLVESAPQHLRNDRPEAGDLAKSIGKSYLARLNDIESENQSIKGRYFVQVIPKNIIWGQGRTFDLSFVIRRSEPHMQGNCDLWEIDNDRQMRRLMWSIPHWTAFPEILREPQRYPVNTVKWIRMLLESPKNLYYSKAS